MHDISQFPSKALKNEKYRMAIIKESLDQNKEITSRKKHLSGCRLIDLVGCFAILLQFSVKPPFLHTFKTYSQKVAENQQKWSGDK